MDRSSKQFVIAMAFAAATFSGSIAGLSRVDQDGMDGSKASAKSGLTVKRGTASGKVAPGNQVSVRADAAPAGTQFAGWTGDVAVLADRFSPTTTVMVPFTAASVTATFTPVTTSKSVPEHVGGGNVLPPTAKPKGYSLTDIAKATAFFATTAPNDRSKETEPNVPFQILYTSSDPSNTFSVRPGTMLYVPIFFADDSEPIPWASLTT
jgi:Divergent InlB B-repeat domain